MTNIDNVYRMKLVTITGVKYWEFQIITPMEWDGESSVVATILGQEKFFFEEGDIEHTVSLRTEEEHALWLVRVPAKQLIEVNARLQFNGEIPKYPTPPNLHRSSEGNVGINDQGAVCMRLDEEYFLINVFNYPGKWVALDRLSTAWKDKFQH